MRLLTRLGRIGERKVDSNFAQLQDWADNIAQELATLQSEVTAISDTLDTHLNP